MSNKMTVFENEEFGQVRPVEVEGEPWFVGKDVAVALRYSNPQKAIRDHIDNGDKTVNESFTVNGTSPTLISESGLYSLILSSKLPTAKKFKRWVTSEILPALRKNGSYTMYQSDEAARIDLLERRIDQLADLLGTAINVIKAITGELPAKTDTTVIEIQHRYPKNFKVTQYGMAELCIYCHRNGMTYERIATELANKGFSVTSMSICRFINRCKRLRII